MESKIIRSTGEAIYRFSWLGFGSRPPASVSTNDYSLGTDNGVYDANSSSDLSPPGDLKFREFRRIPDPVEDNNRVNKRRPNANDIPVMTNSYFHKAPAADNSARHYFVSTSESRAGLTDEQS